MLADATIPSGCRVTPIVGGVVLSAPARCWGIIGLTTLFALGWNGVVGTLGYKLACDVQQLAGVDVLPALADGPPASPLLVAGQAMFLLPLGAVGLLTVWLAADAATARDRVEFDGGRLILFDGQAARAVELSLAEVRGVGEAFAHVPGTLVMWSAVRVETDAGPVEFGRHLTGRRRRWLVAATRAALADGGRARYPTAFS